MSSDITPDRCQQGGRLTTGNVFASSKNIKSLYISDFVVKKILKATFGTECNFSSWNYFKGG